ncbi:MAG: hypothetical protein IID17_11975 [Nitrospinae bacterium]|nr:hypothetical protein [Nitrospinota bacterium]
MHFWKKTALGISIFLILAPWPVIGLAKAKDSKLERRIEALEKIAMRQGVSNQVLERLIAQQRDPNEMRVYFKNGLRFDSRDKRFKYQIGGRIQADVNFFDPDSRFKSSIENTANGAEFRRARFFISGLLYNRVKFKAQYDFVGQTSFSDVYIGLIGIPIIGNITVGHFKEPFSLEDLTSSKYITFLERSLPSAFTPGRNLGIAIHDVLYDGRATWAMGYFRPTPSAPPRIQSEDGGSFSTRLTGVPVQRKNGRQLVHLGFGYSFRTSDDKLSFSSKPESNQGPVTVDTGDIGSEDVHQFNFEAAVVIYMFRVQGEYTLVKVKQFSGLPDIDYHGSYVMVSYFLTGENQNYSKGFFGRITPRRNFMENGGWGAFEAALRFSTIDLNDGSAGKIGGKENNYTAALNWYLNAHTRVMFNYVRAHVYGAPAVNRGHLNIFALRFQMDF